MLTVLVALVLGSWWLALPAAAGGPTSVLLVAPSSGRAAALHTSGGGYQRLVAALDAYQEGPTGSTAVPQSVSPDCFECEVRLTWLVHDVQVWRIDRVHVTRQDGIWIETVVGFDGDLAGKTGRWHRPRDEAALTAILTETGVLPGTRVSTVPNGPGQTPPPASASAAAGAAGAGAELGGPGGAAAAAGEGPAIAMVAAIGGAVGLAAGLGLGLLVRRSRSDGQRVELSG